jgi:phosphate transport system permease protein
MEKLIKIRFYKDKLFKSGIILMTVLSTAPLLLILFYIVKQGISSINWDFFINLPKPVGEKGGGIINGLIGTGILVLVASVIAIPFGAIVGLYLSEYSRDKLSYWVGLCVDVLQGIPSIVLGIIIYLWVVKPTGHFSGLSGSIALAIMMLPPIIKSTE